jgi:hypothetical protein
MGRGNYPAPSGDKWGTSSPQACFYLERDMTGVMPFLVCFAFPLSMLWAGYVIGYRHGLRASVVTVTAGEAPK